MNGTAKVFVRRTDYTGYLRDKYSINPANASCYYSVMNYFEDKYKDVVLFILTSDATNWCVHTFRNKSNVLVVGKQL